MAHESFEDPVTAAVMNRLFVNIKVDREERPDVDHIYMAALRALGQQGGWPLTMFLTPDADPIWGGTYFPKTARYGRPPFIEVLQSVASVFAEQPERIQATKTALLAHLRAAPQLARAEPSPALLDAAASLAADLIDEDRGGLRGSPKFPQPPLMEFLWRSADRSKDVTYREHVLLTLRHMVQGGIYDHIGGGLARYSVDDRWLVPHFEKMLYDNAMFIARLTAVWLRTKETLFRIRIEETVDWLLREMTTEGAFAASLDADSADGEGSFYVWRPDEVRRILGAKEGAEFSAVYDITDEGNFEGTSIPNRLKTMALSSDPVEIKLADQRAILLVARDRRPRPARDDKILADWNGLVIAALASAGAALNRPDWIEKAESVYRFITESMQVDGRFRHGLKDRRLLSVGFASDQATMIQAAIALHQATLSAAYVADARRFVETLDRHYWDNEVRSYRMSADDAITMIARPLPLSDDPVPSANAVAAAALIRLNSLTGEERYRDRADAILAAHCDEPRSVLGKAGLFNALDQSIAAVDIVIVVPAGAHGDALVAIVQDHWQEAYTVLRIAAGDTLERGHPAAGKTNVDGHPTAYVCRGQTCSAPVTKARDLAGLLGSSSPIRD